MGYATLQANPLGNQLPHRPPPRLMEVVVQTELKLSECVSLEHRQKLAVLPAHLPTGQQGGAFKRDYFIKAPDFAKVESEI